MQLQYILAPLAAPSTEESFQKLLEGNRFELERIVSTGQVTPAGEWFDQDHDEWVLLLAGGARLSFEGQPIVCELRPGDSLNIPAHVRHRVEWTDPAAETVWLALHYNLTPGLENRSPAPS